MKNQIALNTTLEIPVAGGLVPEWVKLLPSGSVLGRDGRAWNNSSPGAILISFKNTPIDLPVDVEHSTELKAPQGEPAPAVGWVKELSDRQGEIWGRVEWTESGMNMIGGKAYRYLSPVIIYNRSTGVIVGLTSVGLTNRPNLNLPALNHNGWSDPSKEEPIMLKAVLTALGLPEDATEADVIAKIKALKSDLASANNSAENPSLAKFVPRADYDAALTRATNAEQSMQAITNQQLETSIGVAINQALKDGKITPATVDYHQAQCRQEGGLERFAAFCQAAPVIGGVSGLDGKAPGDNGTAMNSEELKVAAMFGNSAADLAKYGK